jgi:arabinogalactan oligomer/maltooligosaccharide transport system permease protein
MSGSTAVDRPPVSSAAEATSGGVSARRRRRRRALAQRRLILLTALTLAMIVTLFPIYWIVVAALDPTSTLATQSLLPQAVSFENFRRLFGSSSTVPFWHWFANSLKVSLIVAAVTVVLTAMSAYAFSRFRFAGKRTLMKAIVLVQVFPNLLALVAIYLMIQQAGRLVPVLGLNSHTALILVYLGGVLGGNVWLMKGYMDGLPRELDESAAMDGAGHATIFWRILLPLTKPMLAVTGVLAFVACYSEILLARVLLTDNDQLTLALGLYTFARGVYSNSWGAFAAGALIAAVPAVVLFYLLQNWLIKGLTAGSVKS